MTDLETRPGAASAPGGPRDVLVVRLKAGALPLGEALEGRDLSGLQGGRDAVAPADGQTPAWWDADSRGLALAGVDLSGGRLAGAQLRGANLRGADMTDVVGRSADLAEAVLEQVRFNGADMGGTSFAGASAGEADFTDAMLEDARFAGAHLRYATLAGALLDSADFAGADLWGVRATKAEADDASFKGARCDEADFSGADLTGVDLSEASLKKAKFGGAKMRGAKLDGAAVDGAHFDGADLSNASLPRLNLQTCSLKHARLAGAWLDNTRLRPEQLGGAVGEEVAKEYHAARDAYVVLEQNFRSLGNGDGASWAFRKGRLMGKLHERETALHGWRRRDWRKAARHGANWLSDGFVEWLCDYGESLWRVMRAFGTLIVLFAVFYGLTESLDRVTQGPAGELRHVTENPFDLLVYSFLNMLSTSAPDIGLKPTSPIIYLVTSMQGAVGIVLIGLFGYVLGNRMHR
ncbi:pentapeptide repeat-containing protein [Lichenibacterium dinghuense]|uniref:pentapeptide repeat-containing protein n=1 Tax=Lichenibacterium dinghuense TaxID=2895977 RepID=UPI001F1DBDD7|nr:pentapeptide repeat-containing protein [Lichenibacterium sp. 6Y81]